MPTPAVEACIMQLLRDNAGIVALVGARIHVQHRPQKDALPSIVVRKQEYGEDPTVDADETHVTPRIAVDCYAATYFDAYALDQLVRGTDAVPGLEQWTGLVTVKKPDNTNYGSRVIDVISAEDGTNDASDPPDGSDERTYHFSTLFFVLANK